MSPKNNTTRRRSRAARQAPATPARRGRRREPALDKAIDALYAAMLSTRDRDLLFHEVCRALVQDAGLASAAICVLDELSGRFTPVARAGRPLPTARARRPAHVPAGAGGFPLLCGGTPIAILQVQFALGHAASPAAFERLAQLAANLSLTLDRIELEYSRSQLEETLRADASRLRDAAASDARIWEIDLANRSASVAAGREWQLDQRGEELLARHALEPALRSALKRRQLHLCFQPQVGLALNRPTGAEALTRWTHPQLGAIAPAHFIPLAEQSGLIGELGDWLLESVCAQLARWNVVGDLRLSLNLSIAQLRDSAAFLGRAQAIIRNAGIDPARLEFEITEALLASNVPEHARVLHALGAMGCGIAVDDFGTGYSSLSYLRRLPIDTVKIDSAFVRGIVSDPDDVAIVSAVVAVARKLKLDVVAEGVETEQQLAVLRELGCDRYQGNLFSPALQAEEFAARFLSSAGCGM